MGSGTSITGKRKIDVLPSRVLLRIIDRVEVHRAARPGSGIPDKGRIKNNRRLEEILYGGQIRLGEGDRKLLPGALQDAQIAAGGPTRVSTIIERPIHQ